HLREPAGFGPWLLRIAVHLARDHHRASGRRGASVALGEGLQSRGIPNELDARELRTRLDEALKSLPERQRTAFVLRVLEGLDYETIGPAISVTPKSARTLVLKARRGLTAHLGPWLEEDSR